MSKRDIVIQSAKKKFLYHLTMAELMVVLNRNDEADAHIALAQLYDAILTVLGT